jgi:hypothetical protein
MTRLGAGDIPRVKVGRLLRVPIHLMHRKLERAEGVLMRLKKALKEGDHEALVTDVLPEITDRWMWPEALRCITRIKSKVHPSLTLPLHGIWSLHGSYIRAVTNDDLLLIRALRKLLPPYRGGPKKLYRAETLKNRRQRTYGLSWSSTKKVARSYMDGGALLMA